jgi:putative Mg2+ transporter-C (MgtC) family protein
VTISTLDVLLRIGLAGLLGALVGAEREVRRHSAGMRTHALVAVGAALFTLAGAYGFSDIERSSNVDPMRVAAQVASGIGFVGAGAILRHGMNVRGLTTAAALWASAALGVAAGAGFFPGALGGIAVVMASLVALRLVRNRLRRDENEDVVLHVAYERGQGTLGHVLAGISRLDGEIEGVRIEDEGDRRTPGVRHADVELRTARRAELISFAQGVSSLPEVRSVEVRDERAD